MSNPEIENLFVEKRSLDNMGADYRALSSVPWDYTEDNVGADGTLIRTGHSHAIGESKVIAQVPPKEPKPVTAKLKTVVEEGVSYDVETRDDGSEWVIGKTGGPRGVSIMMKPPEAIVTGGGERAADTVEGTEGTPLESVATFAEGVIKWFRETPTALEQIQTLDAEINKIAADKGLNGIQALTDPDIQKLLAKHPMTGFGTTDLRGAGKLAPKGVRGVVPTERAAENLPAGAADVAATPYRQTQAQQADLWAGYKVDKPEGVDFNFANMDSTAGALEQINTISKAYEGKISEAKKGVITLDETRRVADMLGLDEEAAKKAIKDLPVDTQDLHVRALVMRDTLVASAERLDQTARKITGATQVMDEDLLAFKEALAQHATLQANMKGVQTEIARALSAFRIPAGMTGIRRLEATRELVDMMGGTRNIRDLADKWLRTPPDKKGEFVSRGIFGKTQDVVFEIWINSLLSSLRTHEINFLSTQAFMLEQVPERALAALYGKILPRAADADRVYLGEAMALLNGYIEGVPAAARLAWKTFKTGEPSAGLTKIEGQQFNAITAQKFGLSDDSMTGRFVDIVGVGVRMPGRLLMTTDEFNKGVAQQMQRRAIAYRYTQDALNDGMAKPDAARLYADVMEGRIAAAEDDVRAFGDMVTFTKELGEAGQAFQRAVNIIPMGRAVVPFVRTPLNTLKEAGKRQPLAIFGKETQQDLLAGGARRDLALARISLGSAAMAWAVSLAMDGRITGGGPTDPRFSEIWRQKYQPYSINFGSAENPSWVSYAKMEPLATLFGIAANFTQAAQWLPRDQNDDVMTIAMAGVGAVMRDISDKAMLQGIGDMAEAFSGEATAVESVLAGYARSTVPAMVADIESAIDPTRPRTKANPREQDPLIKEFERVQNEIFARTPGLGGDMPPNVTVFGEEIPAYQGSFLNAFWALRVTDKEPDGIVQELIRLRQPLEAYKKEVVGIRLNPRQQYELNQAANAYKGPDTDNKNMREYMNWLIKSPSYMAAPSDNIRANMIKQVHDAFVGSMTASGPTGALALMFNPSSKYFDAALLSDVSTALALKPLGMTVK